MLHITSSHEDLLFRIIMHHCYKHDKVSNQVFYFWYFQTAGFDLIFESLWLSEEKRDNLGMNLPISQHVRPKKINVEFPLTLPKKLGSVGR